LCVSQNGVQNSLNEPTIIQSLNAKDKVFERYMTDLEAAYQAIARNKAFAPVFYEYKAVKGDTVFSVSSRCSIPYDTLATVNRLDSVDTALEGKTLILPAAPGLYVAGVPETTTEHLIRQRYNTENPEYLENVLVKNTNFLYNKYDKFSAEERVFFIDPTMKLPLSNAVITSAFGLRKSPITGEWQHHNGVDLGARTGTEVSACKAGVISFTGWDDVFGNYVIITHANNMQSLYAHLSKIRVETGKTVKTGTVIGEVGQTGAATGPHLHFEIRVNGKAQDPREAVKGL
jgi:murein DD-endopeptidase MepM/ murein hydrolase activator NlpD